jgi:hypothetical protein
MNASEERSCGFRCLAIANQAKCGASERSHFKRDLEGGATVGEGAGRDTRERRLGRHRKLGGSRQRKGAIGDRIHPQSRQRPETVAVAAGDPVAPPSSCYATSPSAFRRSTVLCQ